MYAGRKRKKPVPRSPKPPSLEGVKSNPSKRHRDRLNQELNKLAGLLPFPEDVRSRLDKLSILRLAVGYLKVKSYLLAKALQQHWKARANVELCPALGCCRSLQQRGDSSVRAALSLLLWVFGLKSCMIPRCFHHLADEEGPFLSPNLKKRLEKFIFQQVEAGESNSGLTVCFQALNGFVIAVTGDGSIFYVSPTVQDYLGFHQPVSIFLVARLRKAVCAGIKIPTVSMKERLLLCPPPGSSSTSTLLVSFQSDLIHRSVYELIHVDDRAAFHHELHRAPVSSSSRHAFAMELLAGGSTTSSAEEPSMERSFTCRFRCLLDTSSGFVALHFHGHLKCLLGQQKSPSDRSPFIFFAIASVLQPFSILELRIETLIFQTKHKLDFTPVACDSQGMAILGYTERELCSRGSGYQFVHAADVMYCAESHIRLMKTGESGLEVFRLLTKKGAWVWLQGSSRLVYKGGKPDCIIAQQRALSDEEGEEHLWKRNLQLPLTFVTGEAILHRNDLPEPLDSLQAKEEPQTPADSQPKQCLVGANPLQGPMMKQDASEYSSLADNVLQLVAELDGLSGDEGASDAKDSDSVLVIAETVFEKSEEDGNVSWTMQNLNMAAAELQQWEDALLSLGAEEKSPVQEVGTEVTSFMEQMLLGQDAGKSMAFPPCSEEDDAAAHLQHCWAAPSVFQAAAQPQARGAQGQDAVVPLVSISSAQPEQHVLSNPAGLVGGTVVDAPLEVAKPGQGLQAAVPTSAAMDNPVPNDGMQPGGELVGSSCPSSLHSNTAVSQWHNVPVQANPGNGLGQSTSPGGCQPGAWIAPKHLEAAGTHVESQAVLAGSPKSLAGAGLWLLPSQPAPCPAQGLRESLCSHGDLHEEEAALPARASPEDGGIPKQPHISHLEPSLFREGERAVFQEDKHFLQWLLQAGAAPWCSGAGAVQQSSLLLGSSVGPTLPDHVVLPECQYGNGLFRHESSFLRDTPKIFLPQHPVALPCPSESHPGASPGSVLRFSASLPTKVGAGALEQGPGFPSASSFMGGQALCACEVQLKVRCEGCRS
ncbi:uncharacterized protein AAGF69_005454 [Amazona ochrocephala]